LFDQIRSDFKALPLQAEPFSFKLSEMFERTILDNGLKIISKELKDTETVTVKISVSAGSKFVEPGKEGLSHLVEHMVMNGSKRYPDPLAVRRAIEELGGYINADTSKEEANYRVKVVADDLEKAVDVLFSLIDEPLLDKRELEDEKKVIYEEIARAEDKLERRLLDKFFTLLFREHPLGKRVLGYQDKLKRISTDEVREFFKNFYVPENIVVCAAGRVSHTRLVNLVNNYLGSLKRGRLRSYDEFIPLVDGPKASVLDERAQQARLLLGFPTKPQNLEAHILNMFIVQLLCSNDRLSARLRVREKLAYDVSAAYSEFSDASLVLVYGGFSYNRVRKAIKSITDELRSIKKNPIRSKEFNKVRKLFETNLIFKLETPEDWIEFALRWNLILGNPIEPENYLKELEEIEPEDIQRLAQKLFVPENSYLAVVHKDKRAGEFEELLREGLGST